jgi:hypothetical protein
LPIVSVMPAEARVAELPVLLVAAALFRSR